MKNLLSALLFLIACTTSQRACANWPTIESQMFYKHEHLMNLPPVAKTLGGACRSYHVSVNAFGVTVSTSMVLCCRPNITVFPHFSCFELTIPSAPPGGGAILGDVLLTDFGPEAQKVFQQGKVLTEITISKSDANDIEGTKYSVRSDTYKVAENAKKEKYIRIILDPVK